MTPTASQSFGWAPQPAPRSRGLRDRLRSGRSVARILLLVRLLASAHLLGVFAQPVFAGGYLSGRYDMLALHATGADVVSYTGYLLVALSLMLWATGGPRWPSAAIALMVAAETGQYFAGLAGALDVHIPLGVAIVAGAALLVVALWRPHTRGIEGAS